jgi:hypothetical protein|tara:strand:- start:259 stop:438 length:180 start_codon:yes stop_codon:yes gene_type:complete
MRKLIYKIEDNTTRKQIEFITDRTPQWTEEQYSRNREPLKMELISNEATKETEAVSREI